MTLADMNNCRHCDGHGFKAEKEIVHLRANIAAFENAERIADLEKQGVEREKKRNAKTIADLEKQNADLDSKNADL
jgi:hypothetical protein